ncbi:LuxR C-terminal-related transcriptional regulator [Ideonella dechloratans]|uniref:LuxR C-terminal-related transcriptional regulator n=1 Tax=Ideonella dechloratans TaxID=36863 RepID=UPI0035B21557
MSTTHPGLPDGEALLRAAEVAGTVRNRHQFFLWLRLHLHRFVPHELLLCRLGRLRAGADHRTEVFNCLPLAAGLVETLNDPQGALWRQLHEAWVNAGRRPVLLPLDRLTAEEGAALQTAGFAQLAVHGVDGTAGIHPPLLLALGRHASQPLDAQTTSAGLQTWLPHLHFSAARALQEGDAVGAGEADWPRVLTERELEVLRAMRVARSNAQIGEQLGISALTVKNHLRKIMRKLGAGNRVQAVAEAMARHMIS